MSEPEEDEHRDFKHSQRAASSRACASVGRVRSAHSVGTLSALLGSAVDVPLPIFDTLYALSISFVDKIGVRTRSSCRRDGHGERVNIV